MTPLDMACHAEPEPRRRANWTAIVTWGGLLCFWGVVFVVVW